MLRDQLLRMSNLIDEYGGAAVEKACRRALHFDAVDSAMRLKRILARGLESRPLPGDATVKSSDRDFGRPLTEYEALLGKGARA